MRLLHTSDWHLGRQLHGEDLTSAQRAMVDALVRTVQDEGVDVVLIAGDLYDRAIPPLDAVRTFDEALTAITGAGATVVATSGNHDSATRLQFGAAHMRAGGVHIASRTEDCGEPVVLADEHGPVAVYPLPYLEPKLAAGPLEAASACHEVVLGAAMSRVRADLAARPAGTRSVVVAHAFVAGEGTPLESDSERSLQVGGTARVGAATFDGVDYVALGHLHRAQALGPRIAYSGSPLPYSFSEAGSAKSFTLVDLDAEGGVTTRRVPVPQVRALQRLRGTLDELLDDPSHDPHVHSYLEVTLTDPVRPRDAMARLRTRFPHVLQLRFDAPVKGSEATYRAQVQGRSDLDVCTAFVEHVRGEPATHAEIALFNRALADHRTTRAE